MQLSSRLADRFGEPGLDVHMNVFEAGAELELPRLDPGFDVVEPGQDGVALVMAKKPHRRQHARMRPRPREIVSIEALVETDGRINLLHQRSGAVSEMPAPEMNSFGADTG